MDWQQALDNAVKARRAEAMKTSKQLTLGELILKLEAIADKSKPVIFDESKYYPVGFDSWRGSYAELAITYTVDGDKLSTDTFLYLLKGVVGSTLYGYKGGEFLMGKTTPVWVANYGESHGFKQDGDIDTQAIIDVSQDDQHVIIKTQCIEY